MKIFLIIFAYIFAAEEKTQGFLFSASKLGGASSEQNQNKQPTEPEDKTNKIELNIPKKEEIDSVISSLEEKHNNPEITSANPNLPPQNKSGYGVREFQGELELKTPYGTYSIPGNYGQEGEEHYKIVIPLSEIMPPPPPPEKSKDSATLLSELKNEEKNSKHTIATEETITRKIAHIEEEKEKEKTEAENEMNSDIDMYIVNANRLFNQRRYHDSLTVVERMLKKKPDFARGWIMKGSLLHVQGHKDLALKAWNKALALKPEDPEIKSIIERFQ